LVINIYSIHDARSEKHQVYSCHHKKKILPHVYVTVTAMANLAIDMATIHTCNSMV